MSGADNNIRTFHVKNLNLKTAAMLLSDKLEDMGFEVVRIVPGIITLKEISDDEEKKFNEILNKYGFEIIKDRDQILVEEIKQAVIELIHYMNNMNSVVRKSEYIVEKLGKSYSHLSRVFSKHEPITLEKYIILQKIERIKELIDQDEYTLSEIAYMMDYSSVQYLSNQFKKITGYSVTEYKHDPEGKKNFLDETG
jgi:AraC-like DNA-binding protein